MLNAKGTILRISAKWSGIAWPLWSFGQIRVIRVIRGKKLFVWFVSFVVKNPWLEKFQPLCFPVRYGILDSDRIIGAF